MSSIISEYIAILQGKVLPFGLAQLLIPWVLPASLLGLNVSTPDVAWFATLDHSSVSTKGTQLPPLTEVSTIQL